jgi:hypothetical protein
MQNAISEHNYARSYNRFYGEQFGMFALFDLPADQEAIFQRFLEYLVEEEYCDGFSIMKSMGYRYQQPQEPPTYTDNPEAFDVVDYWQKRLNKSATLPRLPSSIDFEMIEPLHFLLLRDLTMAVKNGRTIDIRYKQTEIINHYFDIYKTLSKKENLSVTENEYYFNLCELFKNMPDVEEDQEEKNVDEEENGKKKRKLNIPESVKVEFGRKYYNIVANNLITNPRWNLKRKFFENHITRAYFIENVSEQEKS